MDNIKISVIIPVYNTEKYLEKCLESVINQNFKEIEIIIINDHSIDNSLNIIEKYMKIDKRIVLINKKENEGLLAVRKLGIKNAKGKYISFIDSDDWVEQNYFSDMYEIASKKNADVVISDFYTNFINGVQSYNIDQKDEKEEILNTNAIKNIFNGNARGILCNKLIRKEVLKNNIFFYEDVSLGEDGIMMIQTLYYSKKILKNNKAYYHYMQNPNSITNKKLSMAKMSDMYKYLNIIEKFLHYNKINLDLEFKRFKIDRLNFVMFNSELNFNNMEYKKIVKDYLEFLKSIKVTDISGKRFKVFCPLLKIFNNNLAFILIYKLNKISKFS